MPIAACHSSPNAYVRKDYDASRLRKVAVFSFHNDTKVPEASKVVTGAFLAGLVEGGKFQVEFPGNVRSFLVSERIIVRTGLDLDTIKLMGKRLGVDAVVLGQVVEYVGADEERRGVVPTVSISSRMVDAQTGEILWMAQCRRTGDDYIKVLDFGKIRSVGALTKKVVGEMIETIP
jgi:TolB-like protein